jgi:hypothetical protein
MIDLNQYPDETVLRTSEVAEWLQVEPKVILRMPLAPLEFPTRERRFLAGDVKAVVRGRSGPSRGLRRVS